MLTSPVNVTIAAASVAGLKANTAASDNNARREPPYVPVLPGQPAETVIEPELPSNSPINHVDAVSATVGNRTILQELSLNIATMLRIPRRPDENLTMLFLRIIATIEAMPQAERLAFEMRAGLKPLKITLTDLLMALRKPDGQEAARLTAMAEAPAAVPGRTAASAATTTYLEEGTSTGHTEETLAMRAAARNSAAGQSVFSAENRMRAEAPPADAKVLQNQLKSLFEPGDAGRPATTEAALADEAAVSAFTGEAAVATEQPDAAGARQSSPAIKPEIKPAQPSPADDSRGNAAHENVAISSTSLKLDQPTLDRIRTVAQAIADQSEEASHADPENPAAEKAEAGDRRLQTLLTFKGLAEAVTAIPAKAAELLAVVVAEAAAAAPPEPSEATDAVDHVPGAVPPVIPDEAEHPDLATSGDGHLAEATADFVTAQEIVTEAGPQRGTPSQAGADEQAGAVQADDHEAAPADKQAMPRHDLTQHAVPFAYAQVQPAREDVSLEVPEDDAEEETDEDDAEGDDADSEPRRPRDEYDAIHDEIAEDEPAIVINRDSSEADRAFALYQRMGGF